MMQSIERVHAVLNLQRPDQAPVAFHNFLMAAQSAGVADLGAWLHDGGAMAEAQLALWREIGQDMIQLENGTCAMAEAVGADVAYDAVLPPHVRQPLITDYAQLDSLEPPDPFTTEPLASLLRAAEILLREIGDRVYIQARSDQGPIALAISLMSYEQFLMDCIDPEKEAGIAALLDFCVRCTIRLCEAYASIGIPGTCIGGMGTSLISPSIWRQFEGPYQARYVQACRRVGVHPFIHTCGHEDRLLPDLVATGCTALELDPRTTPVAVSQATRGRCAVLGMVDPITPLSDGTPEAITAAARELFEIFQPDASLIIGAGCALPPDTPVENCRALVEAAEAYGRY